MADLESFIYEIADQLNIEINVAQVKYLEKYWNLLLAWNKKINLISPKGSMENNVILHLMDSLLPLKFNKLNHSIQAVDFGSGGGLPAVPLKIMNPTWDYTLVESTGKKTIFLNEVGRQLNFNKYRTLNAFLTGGEDQADHLKYDLITARGLAETPILLKLGANWLKNDGSFWLYKGPKWSQEVTSAQSELKKRQMVVKEVWSSKLPLINQERAILVIGFKN